MKQSEVVLLDKEQIQDKIAEFVAKQTKLTMRNDLSEIENPLQLRTNRRIIARLRTALRKIELQEINK